MAATRFYLMATTPSTVTPTANGTWDFTSEASNLHLHPSHVGQTIATGTRIGPWTAAQKALDRYYVSPPLKGAQSISGTVTSQIRVREFATTDNVFARMEIYVVSEDGSTVRGTLLSIADYGPNTELLDSALRNKTYADGDTLSAVSAQDRDRIVFAVGYTDSAGTTPEGQGSYGDSNASDLPVDETTTTALNPWIEFSQSLTFVAANLNKLTRGSKGTSGTTATTASVAPTANALQLMFIVNSRAAGTVPDITSIASTGLTWEKVVTVASPANILRLSLWRAMGVAPSAGTALITTSTTDEIDWSWFEFTGAKTTGTNGSGAIVQFKTNTSSAAATISVTLDNPATDASNPVVFGFGTDTTGGVTPRSTWAEIDDQSSSDELETQWRPNFEITGSETDSNGAQERSAIIVELALDSAAAAARYISLLGQLGMFGI